MDKPWTRKPRDDELFKHDRTEDLFLCHTCQEWYPWFHYGKGSDMIFGNLNNTNTFTYSLLNDDEDRGGYRWSCDICINKILFENNIITITNKEGKLLM